MANNNQNDSRPPPVGPCERTFDPCYTFVGGAQVFGQPPFQNVSESVDIYARMGVVSVYTGKHLRDGEIRKPISAVAIPETNLVAVIHNGRLVSLVNCVTCQIEETYVVRDPVGFAMTRGLRGELVADNADYLYVTSEGAVSIFRFNYRTVRDPNDVRPEIFASVPENTTRFFRGMAISLARRLFFTAYGKEIFAFALADGTLMNRWELNEDLGSALVQSAIDMQMGPGVPPKVFIVSTTQGGTRLFGKMLNFGEPDNTPFQMIGREVVGGLGQIRHCAFDKMGNLVCADSKRRLIHVFPPSVTGSVVSFAPPEEDEKTGEWIVDLKNDTLERVYNPSSVAVLVDPLSPSRKQPLLMVTDFSLDALIFFGPETLE